MSLSDINSISYVTPCHQGNGQEKLRYPRGTPPFIRGDNSLRLAEEAGIGTRDLKRIEVVGLSIKDAHINFGPGAVGKKLSELNS
jgi:hypothetical protein